MSLFAKADNPEPRKDRKAKGAYATKREREAARQKSKSTAGREIGEIPACADPKRRAKCEKSLALACKTYHAKTFALEWSPDHLIALERIQTAIMRGGLFALAMPRGSGKTTLCEIATLWAILNGYRKFVCLIGSDESAAAQLLDSIKIEAETNDLLAADYPEVLYPVRALDGIAHRCKGQLYQGHRTYIDWTGNRLTLPTIAGSKASGAVVRALGITGRIRGLKYKRAEGDSIRPDLVIVDDPQTDESARSLPQIEQRQRILGGAVLGLAGPGSKISGIVPCTVIQKGDLAHRLLDRQANPDWQGERFQLLYDFPTDEALWGRYAEIRAEGLRRGEGIKPATTFYRKHRKAMDAGAKVAWPERYNPDEISALQHAMNLKLADPIAFACEYQNDPPESNLGDSELWTAEQIAHKTNGYARGALPDDAELVTGMIDVQQELLYWVVIAWSKTFTGWVLDYGSWPEQPTNYYTLENASRKLAAAYAGMGLEARLQKATADLSDRLFARAWRREQSAELYLERLLIDANWKASQKSVYGAIRESAHRAAIIPSYGIAIGAKRKPFNEYKPVAGERSGNHWRLATRKGQVIGRALTIETNYWKSFLHHRLATPAGDRGSLTLFQAGPREHQLFAEQLTSEYPTRTAGNGREVDEWALRPGRRDNHLFDCAVGCAVAASLSGCELPNFAAKPKKGPAVKRERVRYFAI